MKEILIATSNRGKAKEITEIFKNSGFTLHFLYEHPELNSLVINENAKSFEGNALIKALIVGKAAGMITLADDSGLCVDYLDGAPGIMSARYSKEGTDAANNDKLLKELTGVPSDKRSCHYQCSVAIYNPRNNFVETAVGIWDGRVAEAPKGNKSFGYAPIFLSADSDYTKTNAESESEELISINHRGKAFRMALKILNDKYLS